MGSSVAARTASVSAPVLAGDACSIASTDTFQVDQLGVGRGLYTVCSYRGFYARFAKGGDPRALAFNVMRFPAQVHRDSFSML